MNRRQISLQLALDQTSIKLDLSSFDKRLVIQKLVYLIQQKGVHLGYSFNWYLRGPYCPGLTEDAFNLEAELRADPAIVEGWSLDPGSIEKIEAIRELWEDVRPGQLHLDLECHASVHYLWTHGWSAKSADEISAELKRRKKDFSAQDVQRSVAKLKRHRLIAA